MHPKKTLLYISNLYKQKYYVLLIVNLDAILTDTNRATGCFRILNVFHRYIE